MIPLLLSLAVVTPYSLLRPEVAACGNLLRLGFEMAEPHDGIACSDWLRPHTECVRWARTRQDVIACGIGEP
jgi:hypothetical protein